MNYSSMLMMFFCTKLHRLHKFVMKERYNETEDQVKSFLVRNECILSYYIKRIVWFLYLLHTLHVFINI